MIYFKDNFLSETLFNELNKKLINFKEVEVDESCTIFGIKSTPELTTYFEKQIEAIEGKKIEMILCFFRQSQLNEDDHWRIHADMYVHKDQSDFPQRGAVLYMSDVPNDLKQELTGTAFWEHPKYGDTSQNSLDIHNEALKIGNDPSKWNLKSIIGHKKNRFVSFPCEYFHSKYPNKSIDKRKVCVMFYKYKDE